MDQTTRHSITFARTNTSGDTNFSNIDKRTLIADAGCLNSSAMNTCWPDFISFVTGLLLVVTDLNKPGVPVRAA